MGYDPDFQDWPEKRRGGPRAKGDPTPPVELWSWVYIANLPFPALMGALLTSGLGLLGLAAGVVLLYEVGRRACYGYPWAARIVSYGGVVVAVAQIFPIYHVLAGMAGVGSACFVLNLREFSDGSGLDPVAALIATVVTGLLLLAWAGAMGFPGWAVYSITSRSRPAVEVEWDGPCKP
jgi:hypothetical protein